LNVGEPDPATRAESVERSSVAVVIVNYRTSELARRCLASLRPEKQRLPLLHIILVDGGSGDGSAEDLAAVVADPSYSEWVSFIPLEVNGGFGWANNQAIALLLEQRDPPEFIHLLNPDSEIEQAAVERLLTYLQAHPDTAAVGSQLLELDGSLTGSAFSFPSLRGELSRGARTGLVDSLFHVPPVSIAASSAREVDWATGASVMFRTDALKEVGLFDEGFFLYHEEIELMWRLRRAGWKIGFEPKSRVRHVGGGSTGVHSRKTSEPVEPRKPRYWYRSRARFFALTRGTTAAIFAYLLWFAGHAIWAVRRGVGLARGAKPFSHQIRDHFRYAFPRRSDRIPAVRAWGDARTQIPTWMERGWS
jgi:N-acetylglucosaminyl-diphospho-decaprenol L-rhamnosyltransferase